MVIAAWRPTADIILPAHASSHAPVPLSAKEAAEILTAELIELAQRDPEGFRYYSFDTIEARIARAGMHSHVARRRDLAAPQPRERILFTIDACKPFVHGMVTIMDNAVETLARMPLHDGDAIQRQLEAIRSAYFYAMRMMTQTPDCLNDPEIRDHIHEAVMRKMAPPTEPASTPFPALQGAKTMLLVHETEAADTAAGLPAHYNANSPYARQIKDLIRMGVVTHYLTLSNEPAMRVMKDWLENEPATRVHGLLDPVIFDQFTSAFEQANVQLCDGQIKQNKFMRGDFGNYADPLALSHAKLYDDVCNTVAFVIVEYLEHQLDVLKRYKKATARSAREVRGTIEGNQKPVVAMLEA